MFSGKTRMSHALMWQRVGQQNLGPKQAVLVLVVLVLVLVVVVVTVLCLLHLLLLVEEMEV